MHVGCILAFGREGAVDERFFVGAGTGERWDVRKDKRDIKI